MRLDATLLTRIEDAGLNASAPPQQRWMDGWLLRLSPGKAKRARCINAVAEGRLPLDHKLERAAELYQQAGLPLLFRMTPLSLPAALDAWLAGAGFAAFDDTRVMALADLSCLPGAASAPAPAGCSWQQLGSAAFAQAAGRLRGSPLAQQQAHAERLALSPVPFQAMALRRDADGELLACGQFAIEQRLAGLYDIIVAPSERGRGIGRALCMALLEQAQAQAAGAQVAYLQVEADNHAARALYRGLGFADAYAYHYRGTQPRG